MGGQNEQAHFRSRNTNIRNISNLHTYRRVGHAKAVTKPYPNTTVSDEADTNFNMCSIGKNFIPIAYTNGSVDVYPYSEAYEPIENLHIVSGDTAYKHTDGNTYILVFQEYLYYGSHMKHNLINPNHIRFNSLYFYDNSDID